MVSIDTIVGSGFAVNELPPGLTIVVAVLELLPPDESVELELLELSSSACSGNGGRSGSSGLPLGNTT